MSTIKRSEKKAIGSKYLIPYIVLFVFLALLLGVFVYVDRLYFGMITVGSVGSIFILILLIRTKRRLMDDLVLFQDVGDTVMTVDATYQSDDNAVDGQVVLYSKGILFDFNDTLFVFYDEITSVVRSENRQSLSFLYNREGNHKVMIGGISAITCVALYDQVMQYVSLMPDSE